MGRAWSGGQEDLFNKISGYRLWLLLLLLLLLLVLLMLLLLLLLPLLFLFVFCGVCDVPHR